MSVTQRAKEISATVLFAVTVVGVIVIKSSFLLLKGLVGKIHRLLVGGASRFRGFFVVELWILIFEDAIGWVHNRMRQIHERIETARERHYSARIGIWLLESGLIAGLVLAAISPFVIPQMTDAQVEMGLVSGPQITADATRSVESSVEDVPTADPNATYNVFRLKIRNGNSKIAENVELYAQFKGCPATTRVWTTNRAYVLGVEKRTNSICDVAIYLPHIAPHQTIRVKIYTNLNETGYIGPPPEDHLGFSVDYLWQYNGRTYDGDRDFSYWCDTPKPGPRRYGCRLADG